MSTNKKTTIKPLGDRVLIKRCEAETKKGGILLPNAAQEKPKMGEVMAVGPGKLDKKGECIPLNLKVGDKVLFSAYAGVEVKPDEDDLLIMSEDEILAVIM
jgi:chaperonin GroES